MNSLFCSKLNHDGCSTLVPFREFAARAIVECQNTCERDSRCASYNFYIPGKVCELNSHTKEEKPDHFVTDELRFYMKREGTSWTT